MTSLLQTAINNLSLQSGHSPSKPAAKRLPSDRGRKRASNPNPESSDEGDFGFSFNGGDDSDDDEEDGDEVVELITRPSTPSPGARGGFGSGSGGLKESGGGSGSVGRESSVGKTQITARDPIRLLPSHIAVRIFLQLDIHSLSRCDRVCKRWRKSSTLNYVWFLHTRSLTLPELSRQPDGTYINKQSSDDPDYDPYDKAHFLTLFRTPLPPTTTPQWSKRESKGAWRLTFKSLVSRDNGASSTGVKDSRVDIDALSSGYITPVNLEPQEKWGSPGGGGSRGGSGTTTPKSKKEMREFHKSLGGRKSKEKGNLGGTKRGIKDLGGAGDDKFDAPW